MKYFFFEDITEEEERKLTEQGIDWNTWVISEERGILVRQVDLEKMSMTLGLETFETEETEYEDIFTIRYVRRDPSAATSLARRAVDTSSFTSHLPKGLVDCIADGLGPIVKGAQIYLTGPHGKSINPVGRKGFFIHIYAAPSGEPDQNARHHLWGVNLQWWESPFGPTGQENSVVISDLSGTPVAELVEGNNLYLYFDFAAMKPGVFKVLMRRTLEQLCVAVGGDPEAQGKGAAALFDKHLGPAFEIYLAAVLQGINKQYAELIEKRQKLTAAAGEALQRYTAVARELQVAEKSLAALGEALQSERIRIRSEFELLVKLPKIRKVERSKEDLHIFTDVLFCPDRKGHRHEIGAFRIELRMGSSEVRWFNLTRKVNAYNENMNAPHIYENGSACLGNAEIMFAQLWARWEIPQIVMLAIQFVETVNEADSAGKYISRWPVVSSTV